MHLARGFSLRKRIPGKIYFLGFTFIWLGILASMTYVTLSRPLSMAIQATVLISTSLLLSLLYAYCVYPAETEEEREQSPKQTKVTVYATVEKEEGERPEQDTTLT